MIHWSISLAGLAHRAEHSPRKREAGGSSPPASTTLNLAAIVQWQGTASVRRKPAFDPPLRHHQCTRGETADAAASEAAAARHGGSSPPGCTSNCSLRQAAKASVLHTDIPRFESWSEHHHLSRSSMAERPADNRKTAVRYRAGEPTTGDRHDNDQTNGAACRRAFIAGGPGAFKPESVGQRAFNPRARGSTPPGSSNPRTHTRLAQSVERRPLKSEVRGSSPRSCTILFEQDSRFCRRRAVE